MQTVEVTILRPEAEAMLDEMAHENLIKLSKRNGLKKDRVFGSMSGLVVRISDDFDKPLEDFKDYM